MVLCVGVNTTGDRQGEGDMIFCVDRKQYMCIQIGRAHV